MAADPTPAPARPAALAPPPSFADRLGAVLSEFEPGLAIVATDLPLPDGGALDALAADLTGAPILVIGLGSGTPASSAPLERVAEAWVGWQSVAPLLSRVLPAERIRADSPARVFLVGRSIPERVTKRLQLLALPALRVIDASFPAADAPAPRPLPELIVPVIPLAQSAPIAPLPPTDAFAVAEAPEPAAVDLPFGDEKPSARWFEALKQRVLRLSPEIIEETDGDAVTFRVAGQPLVRLTKNGRSVMVSPPGGSAPEIRVDDEETLEAALDGVFGRFFGLAATRRRLQASEPRARPFRSLRASPEIGRRK